MASYIPASPFLNLPRELRYEIYDHLCGREPRSYPFKLPPISSLDQTPPPIELQLTCRDIYKEINRYFYGKVTLRFITQPFLQTARKDIHPLALRAIRRAKKIELLLIWTSTHALTATRFCKWLAEQVNLLVDEGRSLESVIISVRDAEEYVAWTKKSGLLQPLEKLKGKVEFRVGEILAADREEEELREKLGEYLREMNRQQ